MAPVTCQILDGRGRPMRGISVTLRCQNLFAHSVLTFESITNEEGAVSMWFPCHFGTEYARMQPRLLDTSLLRNVTLGVSCHLTKPVSTGPHTFTTPLSLLGDELPGVIFHLGGAPRVEYLHRPVASPVDEWYATNQDTELGMPLQSPSPLNLDIATATGGKRKREDEQLGPSTKRARGDC